MGGAYSVESPYIGIATADRGYIFRKRLFDVFFAAAGILFLLPVFIIVAAVIKITEPRGSVFFKQTRIGKDGKPFNMYKFRSMVENAEQLLAELQHRNEIQGAMFKMKSDPRVTRIGKLIRKTSLDELPQLWNVLKGDMSLVGPRPGLPQEVAQYTSRDRLRLLVPPGCTGLWQVSGRNGLSFMQMVEMDLDYISRRSLLFDLRLILKTFVVIVYPKNAY
ncbi:sugar transferase [Cohnella panacarvi]|uniref:sugar transferase n=1 Tax=Cohnella panacarvi TaxID=400776 RepID=UPI00068494D9